MTLDSFQAKLRGNAEEQGRFCQANSRNLEKRVALKKNKSKLQKSVIKFLWFLPISGSIFHTSWKEIQKLFWV